MADPKQVIYSLGSALATQYAVFERDQVLTHTQLNEVGTWLDQQDRLSRTSLFGTGIATGLKASLAFDGRSVTVSAGLGITTDGDLIRLPQAVQRSHVRPYDATAPLYAPLLTAGAPVDILELVPPDDPLGTPIAAQPGALDGRVVLLLMESTLSDPDLCTGDDCDNLGRESQHRLRILLIPRQLADTLGSLVSHADAARKLDELIAYRPQIDSTVTSPDDLARSFMQATRRTLAGLEAAIPAFSENFHDLLIEVFGADHTGAWGRRLADIVSAAEPAAAQPCHDFLKDVVTNWNELRQALLADNSVPLPAPGAFPKHLLAGALADPEAARTPFHPAAGDAHAREAAAEARFLMRRMSLLISQYAAPLEPQVRVTPSHGEDRPLGERAIPWYYLPAVHAGWNRRLSERRLANHNLGYRAIDYGGSPRALDPLAGSIAGHSFFRVEGHLGRPVAEVKAELQKLIAARNLPFEVHSVLAHTEKRRLIPRLGTRYTDLHRFHYLLRQDVDLRLDESKLYADKFVANLKVAVDSKDIPASTDTGINVLGSADTARKAVLKLNDKAKLSLQKQTYSAYRSSTEETRWNTDIAETLGSVGNTRADLGKLARSDFASPLDSLIQTTHPLWLDWLDDLIVAKDDKADDKLLLSRFAADHPGLDHLGGAWRGGTFILVYDDTARVVGDFTVAYPCAEIDEPEPVEPPLKRPPQRRPPPILEPIKVVRPVDLVVGSLVTESVTSRFEVARQQLDATVKAGQAEVTKQLANQTASVEGLVKGVFSTRAATGSDVVLPGKTVATGDTVLDQMVRDVDYKRQQVQTLVELTSRGDLTETSRTQAQAMLAKAQAELGSAVADTTEHVVKQGVDTTTGTTAGVASILATGTMYVTDTTAASTLGTRLDTLKTGSTGTQTVLITNLQSFGRLKR